MNAGAIGYLFGLVLGSLLLPMIIVVFARRANQRFVYGSAAFLGAVAPLLLIGSSESVVLNVVASVIVVMLLYWSYLRRTKKPS